MELLTTSRTGTDPPASIAELGDGAPVQIICTDLPVPEQIIRGIRQYASGNILTALWDFLESAADEPQNPLSHYLCGLALQALGLNAEARDEWEKVVRLTVSSRPIASPSGGESVPVSTCEWVRGMAQHLLSQHDSDVAAQSRSSQQPNA